MAWWYGLRPRRSYSSSDRLFAAKPSRLSRKRLEATSSAGMPVVWVFKSVFISIPISWNSVARPSVPLVYSWYYQRLEDLLASHVSSCFFPTALERTRPHRHRSVHGHSRRGDRECRVALDQDRPRLLGHGTAVGDHRLRHPLRGDAAARRPPRRPARPAPHVRCGPCSLCRELAALRLRVVVGLARRLPRVAGTGRRA